MEHYLYLSHPELGSKNIRITEEQKYAIDKLISLQTHEQIAISWEMTNELFPIKIEERRKGSGIIEVWLAILKRPNYNYVKLDMDIKNLKRPLLDTICEVLNITYEVGEGKTYIFTKN